MPCCDTRSYAPSRESIRNAVEYEPELIEDHHGKLLKQPENPYVARAGRTRLYFLDDALPLEEAREKKEQLDKLYGEPKWRLGLDYETFDAWWYDTEKKEIVFRFKNEYSRIFYASYFNRGLDQPVLEERPVKELRTVKYDLSRYESGAAQ